MVHDVLGSNRVVIAGQRQHMLCILIEVTQTAVHVGVDEICHPKRPEIAGVSEKLLIM